MTYDTDYFSSISSFPFFSEWVFDLNYQLPFNQELDRVLSTITHWTEVSGNSDQQCNSSRLKSIFTLAHLSRGKMREWKKKLRRRDSHQEQVKKLWEKKWERISFLMRWRGAGYKLTKCLGLFESCNNLCRRHLSSRILNLSLSLCFLPNIISLRCYRSLKEKTKFLIMKVGKCKLEGGKKGNISCIKRVSSDSDATHDGMKRREREGSVEGH